MRQWFRSQSFSYTGKGFRSNKGVTVLSPQGAPTFIELITAALPRWLSYKYKTNSLFNFTESRNSFFFRVDFPHREHPIPDRTACSSMVKHSLDLDSTDGDFWIKGLFELEDSSVTA